MHESRAPLILFARRMAICAVLVVALAPVVWLFSIAYKPTSDIFASPPHTSLHPDRGQFRERLPAISICGRLLEVEPHHRRRIDCAVAPASACRPATRLRARPIRARSGSRISFSSSAQCPRSRR